MSEALVGAALATFFAGVGCLYGVLFGRPPPPLHGFKGLGVVSGNESAADDGVTRPRHFSVGERWFLGAIGVVCWVIAGGSAALAMASSDDEGTPETTAQPTTSVTAETCPPIPEDKFLVGAYYRRLQSDPLPWQVVDPDDRDELKNPRALWIGTDGQPIINPKIPLGPEIIEVVEAFGSVEAVIMYNACALQPDS